MLSYATKDVQTNTGQSLRLLNNRQPFQVKAIYPGDRASKYVMQRATYQNAAGNQVAFTRAQINLPAFFADKHVAANLADARTAFNDRIDYYHEIVPVNTTAANANVWKDALIAAAGQCDMPAQVGHFNEYNVNVNVMCRNLTEDGYLMNGQRNFIDNGVQARNLVMTIRVYRNDGGPGVSIRHIH